MFIIENISNIFLFDHKFKKFWLIQKMCIYIVLKCTICLMRVKNLKVKVEMKAGKFDMKYTDFSYIFAK